MVFFPRKMLDEPTKIFRCRTFWTRYSSFVAVSQPIRGRRFPKSSFYECHQCKNRIVTAVFASCFIK
ncbi:hypothetical protein RB195_002197 [Necator americanus]|uniref:Uncharacterized protein n=1 Tax=Necator americanus TaxID=51031 RepID=A0ABR1DID3_NECAM